ncbi:hypothetical protein C3F09_06610 [candidate division GN15 bacterium]|uniref:Uncharacterized protein n=1 Tax=candidate division GN15 bacterium TaxID=2072418 RepID=A0A855X0Q4_9BACT|nr:MAG: hypothetical protein C3F09_06610 [candidate division GN15 bacterium]
MAAVPRQINYQGRATDASGNPVPDGDYDVRFNIFDHPTAGSGLWGEIAPSIHTTGGLFTHMLGSINPLPDSIFAKYDSLYLRISFNGQVLSPRVPLVSTGYAFRVNSVDGASGGAIDGRLELNGNIIVWFDPDQTGNASVYLPDDGIGRREIWDEPGIASATFLGYPAGRVFESMNAVDVVTVSLTTPATGYIVVEAKFWAVGAGSCLCYGWVQIDEASGGDPLPPYHSRFGQDSSVTWGATQIPGFVSRVFYKPAGSYTFRLEGAEFVDNCAECYPQVQNAIITARYYSTAYGTVEAIVPPEEAGNFENAAPVTVDSQTKYRVDLRELELRAAKAEAAAERARANAEKAKSELLRAKYEPSSSGSKDK